MQNDVNNRSRNKIVEDFQIRDNLIATLKNRFTTYGYKQVRTSIFESYDMYSDIIGTVPKDEMIKVIDSTGKVLVLRPDVTIPITKLTAANQLSHTSNQRLFYVLDVFRSPVEQDGQKESTQAGVELFGENSPEIDSEIIMLAIHTLKDLDFNNFKIEIGHAGFYKELIQHAGLSKQELELLQALIQSKNIAEIEPFLSELTIDSTLKQAIQSIPLLYGNPDHVIQQAKGIIQNDKMDTVLQNLIDVYEVLKDYGAENNVIFNLGLINNMNYYTGVIFQGFIDIIGQPVLMGGRYDHLGTQFDYPIPAIGFAFEVDSLLHAVQQRSEIPVNKASDITIYYHKERRSDALLAAFELRNNDFQVLAFPVDSRDLKPLPAQNIIIYEKDKNTLSSIHNKVTFSTLEELLTLLHDKKGAY